MKYNKSEIMKAAWVMIKSGMSRREALKSAWHEAKVAVLISAGARRWTKGSYDRLYINADVLGYTYEKYNTGNIRCAKLGDCTISNSEMYRVLCAKTYIDVKTFDVCSTYNGVDYSNAVKQFVSIIH